MARPTFTSKAAFCFWPLLRVALRQPDAEVTIAGGGGGGGGGGTSSPASLLGSFTNLKIPAHVLNVPIAATEAVLARKVVTPTMPLIANGSSGYDD